MIPMCLSKRLAIQAVALLLLPWVLATQAAARPDRSEHEPMPVSEGLSPDQVYTAALEHAPEQLMTAVREQQGTDYRAWSEQWFPGVPRWQLALFDDRLMDDTGAREIEAGVALDLWRPGERGAARRMASAQEMRHRAWQTYLRLAVAGRLRRVLSEMEMADAMLAQERRGLQASRRLLETTTILYESGAVPRVDVLQARTLVLERERAVAGAEAELVDAEYAYRSLTGLDVRPPAGFRESSDATQEIREDHPWLSYLRSELAIEQSRVQQARREARGSPVLSVGMRRDRGAGIEPWNDALALSVSVPLGGRASVSAQVSEAESRRVESQVALVNARRELMRQLHEVQHQQELTSDALVLSAEELELNRQRYRMAQTAFENGETDLLRVVTALEALQDAEQSHEELQLRQQALHSEFNQIIGVLP